MDNSNWKKFSLGTGQKDWHNLYNIDTILLNKIGFGVYYQALKVLGLAHKIG